MKTFLLIKSHLKQYIVKNKVIFVLFMIGGIINSIVFCYLYGNLLPAVRNKNSLEIYYRQYRVCIRDSRRDDDVFPDDEYKTFLDRIQKVMESGLFESVTRSRFNSKDEVCATVKGSPPIVGMKGTVRTPVGSEVIVPSSNRHAVGEKISLLGQELTVIGQHTGDAYYVSAETLDRMTQSNTIYAVSTSHYDARNDLPEHFLKDTFPNRIVATPAGYVLQDQSESVANMIGMCACYLMATIAFAALFKYLLESMSCEMIVSSIVGAPKSTLAVLMFWEGTILTGASSLAGILLHWCLTPVFFSRISASTTADYTVGDYGLIFLVMFVTSVVVMLFSTLRYAFRTPVEARRYRCRS